MLAGTNGIGILLSIHVKSNVHNEGRAPLLRASLSIVGLEVTGITFEI